MALVAKLLAQLGALLGAELTPSGLRRRILAED
jgi:hypothetical protein